MVDCLFCKIANHDIDSDTVFESDDIVAFRDINPVAPTHVLVVPRRHISSAHELGVGDADLLGRLFAALGEVAEAEAVAGGHRIVTNVGAEAGQSVDHLHFHLIGGRSMSWPPG